LGIIYFKFHKSQIPVIEQASRRRPDAADGQVPRLLSVDDLCGFPGRGNLDQGNPDVLLHSMSRFFKFLPGEQRQAFVQQITEQAS
jgi:hypothetical protein